MKIEEAVKAIGEKFVNLNIYTRIQAYGATNFSPTITIEVSGWNDGDEHHKRGEGQTLQQAVNNLLNPPDQLAEINTAIQEVEGMGK